MAQDQLESHRVLDWWTTCNLWTEHMQCYMEDLKADLRFVDFLCVKFLIGQEMHLPIILFLQCKMITAPIFSIIQYCACCDVFIQ